MSEELCPSSADNPVPLPFFVRTANQVFPPTTNFCCFCKPLESLIELEGAGRELPEAAFAKRERSGEEHP